ncbi:hypothetical protein JYB64_05990 [Algoriphagus aestuarii]|nr:hypothetical protein [Algoriphagus aestuarii]
MAIELCGVFLIKEVYDSFCEGTHLNRSGKINDVSDKLEKMGWRRCWLIIGQIWPMSRRIKEINRGGNPKILSTFFLS